MNTALPAARVARLSSAVTTQSLEVTTKLQHTQHCSIRHSGLSSVLHMSARSPDHPHRRLIPQEEEHVRKICLLRILFLF